MSATSDLRDLMSMRIHAPCVAVLLLSISAIAACQDEEPAIPGAPDLGVAPVDAETPPDAGTPADAEPADRGEDGGVDAGAPDEALITILDRAPPMFSASTRIEVEFHSDGAATGFRCAVDRADAELCSSPWTFDVIDGPHELSIAAIGAEGQLGPPATAHFTVDTVPPNTVLIFGPPIVDFDSFANFAFAAEPEEPGITFECAVDSVPFRACTSPHMISLADGAHRFQVRAVDAAGNVDPTPPFHDWRIDTTFPPVFFTSAPPDPSNRTAPTFEFISDDPTATFECQVDGVNFFAPCTSPHTTPPLSDGVKLFRVRATDVQGLQTNIFHLWTLDTVAPGVAITAGPSGPTNTGTPELSFVTSGAPALIECAFDAAPFSLCVSPVTTTRLAEGAHTFIVRATDAAGNAATDGRAFIVDTVPPVVTVIAGPSGSTNDATPTWTFTAEGAPIAVECAIDGGPYAACADEYTPLALPDGPHLFTVRAIDAAVNTGSDTRAIELDGTAPVISITGGPSGITLDTTPTFSFSIAGDFAVSRCRIDAGAFALCASPFTPAPLGGGEHIFEVQADDAAGNTGNATRAFEVDANAPTIFISVAPPDFTNNATPVFELVAGPTASTVECRFDQDVFLPCSSPFIAAPLSEGSHVFEVQACTIGQVCAGDTHAFVVDLTPPLLTLTGGPLDPLPSASSQPVFTFTAGGASTVRCRVVPAPFVACADTFAPSAPLANGAQLLEVVAGDRAGNTTTRTRAFTVDTLSPTLTLRAPLIPARTSEARPAAYFSVVDMSAIATTCAIDAAPAIACDGLAGFRAPADLPEGPHRYRLTATDAAGNNQVTDVLFTVDLTPPQVVITGGPLSPSNESAPSFTFTIDADTVHTRCELDTGAVIDPCTSGVVFTGVAPGTRVFTVIAFDAAIPANSTPATYTFVLGICGDNAVQGTEECDGTDLNGESCTGGTLLCSPACTFDTSQCATCGNGVIEFGEECDGAELGGATCNSRGFDSGALGCSSACAWVTAGCGTCGDGAINGAEVCDGAALDNQSCVGIGELRGTLACNPSCDDFDRSACNGGFIPANTGFTGTICSDGVKYARPETAGGDSPNLLLACTEDQGLYRATIAPFTSWLGINGSTINNLHGRSITPQPDGPSAIFLTDNSGLNHAFRGNSFATGNPPTWTPITFTSAGQPFEMYAVLPSTSSNNIAGGWHPTLGATVLHGNFTAAIVPSFVGASGNSVTGTVRSLAKASNSDVYAAVHGETPAGAPGNGAGIWWACDISGTSGGTFVQRDSGIAESDKVLVWSLTVDPSSFTSTLRTCPTNNLNVSGWATTYYVALRGGGQIYKTIDGGLSWAQSNAGLPSGAEVYMIAIDCYANQAGLTPPATRCANSSLLYAATSAGVYESIDAGSSWTLHGLEGAEVKSVALQPQHALGVAPRMFVGVEDAIGIYERTAP